MRVAQLLALALGLVATTVRAQVRPSPSPSPSPSPAPPPEEDRCPYNAYRLSFEYERDEGLEEREAECVETLRALRRLQFGPPTEWEVFNTMCKGACRSYGDRVRRLQTATDCDCTKILDRTYQCPTNPAEYLCSIVEYCYDWDTYEKDKCLSSSCGRWATNEEQWRNERAACGVPATALAAATAFLATLAATALFL